MEAGNSEVLKNDDLKEKTTKNLADLLKGTILDYRKKKGIRYPLFAILVMLIYAALCGFTGGTDVETFCKREEEYFRKLLGIDRIPSHDTFGRVARDLDPITLAKPLSEWIRKCYPDLRIKIHNLYQLRIDGKAIRGAINAQENKYPPYLLNAMYLGETIGLMMRAIAEKANETGTIPEFLKEFNLINTVVTADAAATTEAVITQVVESGGFFVFPIKGNQSKIQRAIKKGIDRLENTQATNPSPGIVSAYDELPFFLHTPKKAHGREERAKCVLLDAHEILKDVLDEKPFLKCVNYIAVIDKTSKKKVHGEYITTTSRRFFITNLEDTSPEEIRKIVGAHWDIEMGHWKLDNHFLEDRKTSRKGFSMVFGAMLRRFAMMLHARDKSKYVGNTLSHFADANKQNLARIEKLLFIG